MHRDSFRGSPSSRCFHHSFALDLLNIAINVANLHAKILKDIMRVCHGAQLYK